MYRSSIIILNLLGAIALAWLLTACGGGSGGSGSAGGDPGAGSGVILSITDAPLIDADIAEVWVRFTKVIVHAADGSEDTYLVEDRTDPDNILPYRDIELKSLVGGKTMLLGEIPLDHGDYSWIRLVIDPDNTHVIEAGGGDFLAKCPSCSGPSNFKLNRAFTIDTTGWIDFIIDFDLRKSLTLRHPNQERADFDYILRPTLRIIDTELASSYIHGFVTDERSEDHQGTPDDCVVYVYEGAAADVEPDDICSNPDPDICPDADRPLRTAEVNPGDNPDYDYITDYIYPGLYTVVLLCEPDDAEVNEDHLLFMSKTEVLAEAVPGGAPVDLAMQDTPVLSLLKTRVAPDTDTVQAGDELAYEISVVNDGNVTLTNIMVTDELAGLSALDCGAGLPTVAELAPAAAQSCTATRPVTAGDAGTVIANTASASSVQTGPVDSNTVTTAVDAL